MNILLLNQPNSKFELFKIIGLLDLILKPCRNYLKRLIILFNLFLLTNLCNSQNFKLIGDSIVPSDPEEWILNHLISLKTNYNSTKIIKCIVTLENNDLGKCLFTDSVNLSDTILSHDTLGADFLLKDISSFSEVFSSYVKTKHKFLGGDYLLKVKFYDSNYNFMNDSATKYIQIIDDYYPELIYPNDYNEIYDSLLNSTIFKWAKAKKSGYSDFYYNFKIYQINDSTDIMNLENCFTTHTTIFNTYTKNDTTINISNLRTLIDTTKLYSWSVKTFIDSFHTQPLAANSGITPPYVLKRSSIKRANDCANSYFDGFESGTLNGWICYTSKRNKIDGSVPFYKANIVPPTVGRHTIVTSGTDINTSTPPLQTVPTNGGIYALKLGNPLLGSSQCQMVSKTFFVDLSKQNIKIRYAAVLNFGNHKRADEAFLIITILRKRRNATGWQAKPYGLASLDLRPKDVPMIYNNGNWFYSDWNCMNIDLSNYVGNDITIQISTGNCILGGDPGYAYIDFCGISDPNASLSSSSSFCYGSSVSVNGTANNYNQWKYSVQQCNSMGTPIGDIKYTDEFFNSTMPSSYDITTLLQSTGANCGSFIVTLYAKNACSDWTTATKQISINCPALNLAGNDKCCTGGICNIQIGSAGIAGNTYSWSPSNCLSNSAISNPFFNPSTCPISAWPKTYQLTVTDNNGCQSTDEVKIFNQSPTLTSITLDTTDRCYKIISFSGGNYSTLTWTWTDFNTSTTKTDHRSTFVFPNYGGTVTVTLTLTNACGTVSSSYIVFGTISSATASLQLAFNNIIVSNDKNPINRILTIYENGIAKGTPNAYFGSTDAILEVLDRWGQWHKVWEHHGSTMLNGDIVWDGKIDGNYYGGNQLFWRLGLKNCNNSRSPSYEYNHQCWLYCTKFKHYGIPFFQRCVGEQGWRTTSLNEIILW